MLCIQWSKIILLDGLVSLVFSLTPKSIETREVYIVLNSDGTLKYPSKVPDCGTGRKIFLMSYSYQQIQCETDCYSIHEETLLPADIMLLHEKCSLKEKCYTLSFMVRSEEQKMRTNSVKVNYRCLDHTSTFIDICKPCEFSFNDTLYLTASRDSARLYNVCECFVNLDGFSIKAEDVRLNSIQEKKCTKAVVKINSKEFKCDPEEESFDSVFNRTVETTSFGFLSLEPKSTTEFPSMVLITVSPYGTARLNCIPKPSRPETVTLSVARTTSPASTTYSVEQMSSTNSVTYKDIGRSPSYRNSGYPFLYPFVVTLIVLIIGALSVFIYRMRSCFKGKGDNKTNENEGETEELPLSVSPESVPTSSGNVSQSNPTKKTQTSENEGRSIPSADILVHPPTSRSLSQPTSPTSDILHTPKTQISETEGRSIPSGNPDIIVHSPSSRSLSPPSSPTSDILQLPIVPCHTTSKSLLLESGSAATFNGYPSETTEEQNNHDSDVDEETPIYIHDPLPADETENKLIE